jgi:hypothetical protein
MRGSKELEVMFKPPRTRKPRKTTAGAAAIEEEEEEELEAANSEVDLEAEEEDDDDEVVGDGWHQLSESESELESIGEPPITTAAAAAAAIARPVASSSSGKTLPTTASFRMPKETASARAGANGKGSVKKKQARSKGPEVMIEDSDVDDVEIIA